MGLPKKTVVLKNVNCILKVPGFRDPIFSKDLTFDPSTNALYVKTTETVVPLYRTDMINIQVMDLEIPTAIRNKMRNDGWEDTTVGNFIAGLSLTLSDDEF